MGLLDIQKEGFHLMLVWLVSKEGGFEFRIGIERARVWQRLLTCGLEICGLILLINSQ